MLVYLVKGKLPWQGVRANNKAEKYHKIMEKKMATPIEYLCLGLPTEFATYLHYCRSLRFDDRPDYGILKKLFRELMLKESLEYDCLYDWTFSDPTTHLREDSKDPKEEKVPNALDVSKGLISNEKSDTNLQLAPYIKDPVVEEKKADEIIRDFDNSSANANVGSSAASDAKDKSDEMIGSGDDVKSGNSPEVEVDASMKEQKKDEEPGNEAAMSPRSNDEEKKKSDAEDEEGKTPTKKKKKDKKEEPEDDQEGEKKGGAVTMKDMFKNRARDTRKRKTMKRKTGTKKDFEGEE